MSTQGVYDKINSKIKKAEEILLQLGYETVGLSSEEFYDYMTGETPTGYVVTINDVLDNEFFMVHEVAEINELKRMGVPINKHTVIKFYPKVYEAHLTAMELELTYSLNKRNYEWLKHRLRDVKHELDGSCLPQEFSYLQKKFASRWDTIIKKFGMFY
jgi:hypothetical protein